MKQLTMSVLAAATMLLGAALPAQATPTTWSLAGVMFNDGASASGSFTIDAAAQTVSGFNLSTTGGALSAFNYDTGNSGLYFNGFGPNAFTVMTQDGMRYMTFSFLDPLGSSGTHAINYGSSWECYNCSPYRMMVSGSVTADAADVPEPATLVLMAPVLGMLLARRRKQRAA